MPTDPVIRLSFPESDIAVLTLDDPHKKANVLSRHVLEELSAHLDVLEKRTDLAGLVVRSAKPGSFIAGADLYEFAASFDMPKADVTAMCNHGRKLFQRLSNCPFVTLAAIDGICVGGGAELALWCDRRVVADDSKTQIGFPEVKIGLFPGWGGTARSTRIVGLANAVEFVTSSENIDGRTAYKMGLATDVVPASRVQEAAVRLIRTEQKTKQYLDDRRRWSGPVDINDTELGFLGATAYGYIQQQTKGNYPAPLAALEVMLGAATSDIDAAGAAEAEGMAALFGSPVNRALVNVFFLSDRNKKDKGVERDNVAVRPIKSVAVIGAGIMGQGIAAANLKRDVPVTMTDAAPNALAGGVQKILEEVSYNKQTKGPDPQRAVKYASLLNATTTDVELAGCDLVIEAVVESPEVKRQVFARIEPQMRADAILASNTSTIPITRLAEGLKRPAQFCGIHFFNPVRKMPLVEVIRGRQTSDETIVTAVAYAKAIGKSPIVVNDGPGFLVNRLLLPYMNESIELLLDGVDIAAIDRAARNFGMPMGPIALFDVVGLDTAFYAGRVMYDAFPDRIMVSPVVPALIKAGRLGQKSGSGFFKYAPGKDRGETDPTIQSLLGPMIRGKQKLS
ncbi:MAG TPA: 3-hydroxyacyl-CoA dehydrogenase NAD-binding domain-containing protein, partial [Pirellulales bacterium]